MKSYVFLLILAISLAHFEDVESCSCMPTHPQALYCKADFVILARIKREKTYNDTRIYKVRVRKEYKLSEKAAVALKSGRLLSPSEEPGCAIRLEVGKVYALSGKINSLKAHINLCQMAIQWQDLTRRQRKGLKMMYKHGCTCRVENCKYQRCPPSEDLCRATSKCHTDEGICLRQSNKRCNWTRNTALASCLKKEYLPFLGGPGRRSGR